MNDEQLNGQWQQLKGKVRKQFGKLTDDDVEQIKGKRQNLIGKVRERYGDAQEAAAKKVNNFLDSIDSLDDNRSQR